MAGSEIESVTPVAVSSSSGQSELPGDRGQRESGLTPTDELRLVAQSLGWLKGQRFPTHVPIDQIRGLAQAENRRLTAPEVVVLTAADFLDHGDDEPASLREDARKPRLVMKAVMLILQAERMNQVDDHRSAGLAE